jgi:pimeloyl-ACP methyl ester carboxylesterase
MRSPVPREMLGAQNSGGATMSVPVIALPGGVMPAAIRYAPLQAAVDGAADFHVKDLEVYAGEAPPPSYSVTTEVDALAGYADSLGLERFHLVGYSGGGFVSLAFAGAYPKRLLSLALFEPARVPGTLTAEEAAIDGRFRRAMAGLEGSDFMRAFVSLQLRDGVEAPPPPGPPAPWMRTRPAGLARMMTAFTEYAFDRQRLRACEFPVLLGYGDQTSEFEEIKAAVLARLLPDIRIRRFRGIHHFVPPELIYNAEHLDAIRALWGKSRSFAGT